MTEHELYVQIGQIAAEILQVPQFDASVNMMSTPEWDSLNHVQLLSAIEKKFSVEITPDEAFKLTSADRLVRYVHGILGEKP